MRIPKSIPLRFYAYGVVGLVGYSYLANYPKPYKYVYMPFALWLDPERAHRLAIKLTSWGAAPKADKLDPPTMKVKVFGKYFRSPIGLAAGFDKHGEAYLNLVQMGFSHVEVGTVTPLPQKGNPRPRVFRLMEDGAIINRYGFNSDGFAKVVYRLKPWLQFKTHMKSCSVGVNIGKNKDSVDPIGDYVSGVREFGPYADYLVINVSSPNTPGLRSMQGKEQLQQLLDSVTEERNKLKCKSPPPLLVKISPDLSEQDKQDIAEVVTRKKGGADGIIVTNTTVTRPPNLTSPNKYEEGGLSGRPLLDLSLQTIRDMYRLTQGTSPTHSNPVLTN